MCTVNVDNKTFTELMETVESASQLVDTENITVEPVFTGGYTVYLKEAYDLARDSKLLINSFIIVNKLLKVETIEKVIIFIPLLNVLAIEKILD